MINIKKFYQKKFNKNQIKLYLIFKKYIFIHTFEIIDMHKWSSGRIVACHDMHKWSSGRIVACHAIDPGSIPGLCTENFFLKFTI